MSILRKHWKNFILSAFAVLWTACSKETIEHPEDVYGCPSDICSLEQPEPTSSEAVEEPAEEDAQKDSTIKDITMQPAIYGPPCMFNGTCGQEPHNTMDKKP